MTTWKMNRRATKTAIGQAAFFAADHFKKGKVNPDPTFMTQDEVDVYHAVVYALREGEKCRPKRG